MSVYTEYIGGFGNNVFQYVCGRLFSRAQGLKLMTSFPFQEVLSTTPHEDLEIIESPNVNVTDKDDDLFSKRPRARYFLSGFFQRSGFYCPKKNEILEFMKPVVKVETNKNDIVAHLRMGDYPMKWMVHPSWFIEILKKEKFDKLYLVTDGVNDRYFSYFKAFSPIVIRGSRFDDWNFIRSFDRILAPNSTFSWWAAFFSQASKIYVHKKWINGHVFPGNLSDIPNGIQVDGPYADERAW